MVVSLVVMATVLARTAEAQRSSGSSLGEPIAVLPNEGFTTVGWVRELSDGRIIVADVRERRLVICNLSSGEVEEIGRAGDGPGEFAQISGLFALGADSSLLEDRGARRWIIYDGPRAVTTIGLTHVMRTHRPSVAGADSLGRILDLQPFAFRQSPGIPYVEMRQNADSLLVLLLKRRRTASVTTLITTIDTVARLRGRARGQTIALRSPGHRSPPIPWLLENPLAAEEQAFLFHDGWLAIVYAAPYHVEWIGPSSQRVRGPALSDGSVRVNERIKQGLISWKWPKVEPPFDAKELPPWPANLPPFLNDALLGSPDGHLVVQRTYNPLAPGVLYDVIDRTGKLVRRLQLPPNERLVGFGRSAAYTVVRDNEDIEWLRKSRWPLRGAARGASALPVNTVR